MMSHLITFVTSLLAGGGLIAAILATNFFDNHFAAEPLIAAAALLATFGLYGLLARLVLRNDRDLDGRVASAGSVGMRLTSVPLVFKISFFFLLLPLLLPIVRRAPSWGGVAARAMGFWLGLGALGVLVILLLRLLFHH